MTSAHYFINISQNILNLWMKLIFLETRHPGLQFEHKNETIPIRIESDMIFQNWLYRLLQQLRENWILLAPHSHQSPHLMHRISSKAKIKSRFMILCQTSLNGLLFIFPPPLLYKPLISFILEHTKTQSLLLSWVLVKLSSLIISWSSWDSRYWVRLTLPLLTLLFVDPKVPSSTIWILHEGIISFPNCLFMLPWWESKIKAW